MSSMPRFDAPSISRTSIAAPRVISVHGVHTLHGVGAGPFSQLSAFESTRAAVVFPTPRIPVKRYAWWIRSASIAFFNVRVTCS